MLPSVLMTMDRRSDLPRFLSLRFLTVNQLLVSYCRETPPCQSSSDGTS